MGREIRRVPKDWQHPKDERTGEYKPLLGSSYSEDAADFMKMANEKGLQEAVDYHGDAPDRDDYMPEWPEAERTHLMMYEDTSEGTPISPAFETPEALARWLADNGASAFGSCTATYEEWLSTCRGGWAPSMVMQGGELMSGVEFEGRRAESEEAK
mgnify:CR=1 FL=1